jgi:hypothetical protein
MSTTSDDDTNQNSSGMNYTNMILLWVGIAVGVVSICAVLYYYSRRKMSINELNIQRILSDGRISPQMTAILKR